MIEHWLSYSPQDFLMFSAEAYWGLFDVKDISAWLAWVNILSLIGLHILAQAWHSGVLPSHPKMKGAVWTWAGQMDFTGRGIFFALAFAALLTATFFLMDDFARIFPAMRYAGYAFWVLGVLAFWFGTIQAKLTPLDLPSRCWDVGGALTLYAILLHPLLSWAIGEGFYGMGLFGTAPDPTAIGTLGVLLMAKPGWRRNLLLVIPVLWCLISAAMLLTLGAWQGWIPLAAVALTLIALLMKPSVDRA